LNDVGFANDVPFGNDVASLMFSGKHHIGKADPSRKAASIQPVKETSKPSAWRF
jgi:hypothetical protein